MSTNARALLEIMQLRFSMEVLAALSLQQTTEIPTTTLILAVIHDSDPHHWQSF